MKDGVGKWRAADGLVPATLVPVVLVLAVSLLLNGCGGRPEAGTGKADAGAGEVVIWSYYETKQQKEGLDRLVEGFNNRQKDYVARWEYRGLPRSLKNCFPSVWRREACRMLSSLIIRT